MLSVDVGVDAADVDPKKSQASYRVAVSAEVPIVSRREHQVEHERALASMAKAQGAVALARLTSELSTGYALYDATTRRLAAIDDAVLPAAVEAAKESEESYRLGRAGVLELLDAERAELSVRTSRLETTSARFNAWIDVEHILGTK
jgi:cobalt-zinc-cadmium efflux system outer membrane protein